MGGAVTEGCGGALAVVRKQGFRDLLLLDRGDFVRDILLDRGGFVRDILLDGGGLCMTLCWMEGDCAWNCAG
jgi:hypothetical protein